MKKILLIVAIIIGFLFIMDMTILKDNGLVENTANNEKYEKIEKPNDLPVGLEVEERAPSFELTTLDGEKITSEDLKGKRVLLNFWATWCPPCKEEMPDMQKLYEEYKDEDVVVVGVNVTSTEKNREDVEKFVKEYQLTFPILMDEIGEVTHQFEILSFPTTYFIDSDGVIRSKVIGALSKEKMYAEMNLLP
ncbi:redoxin domain-containing protein [Robertmurraya yapensis]|uniref:Redoxin domain-containing protein n=1 Tax=Bacillus yapensis TaxID=2492960 RepID=A0A431W6I7_9BACI|nr:TlpA family protein disulfide reductase [Bacillus yapensis]RTR31041.1 redoxin domain-containing protein [Bacillus yapensis]TKS95470.1 redoxin domain-containing protein [Bacillus yapensis]